MLPVSLLVVSAFGFASDHIGWNLLGHWEMGLAIFGLAVVMPVALALAYKARRRRGSKE